MPDNKRGGVRAEAEVGKEIECLQKELACMDVSVKNLYEKLKPIFSINSKAITAEGGWPRVSEDSKLCPLASEIRKNNKHITNMRTEIDNMINWIEI